MAYDGLFIHHLLNEIKDDIIDKRINHFLTINETDFLLQLSNKKNLLITINPNNAYLAFTEDNFLASQCALSNYIKKHLDGGIITNIYQHSNDRIVIIELNSSDELGYLQNYKLIVELTGKNSNIIITDDNFIILEALKKSYLTDERIIQVKAKYSFLKSNKKNPFECIDEPLQDGYEGISKQTYNELTNTWRA